jgi:hypothetical protein
MHGFSGIRDVSRGVLKDSKHNKSAKQAFKIRSRIKMRSAFDNWKQSLFEKAVFTT